MTEFLEDTMQNLSIGENPRNLPLPVEQPILSIPTVQSILASSSSSAPHTPVNREKKKVSFAADTIVKFVENIASSITSHQYVRTIGHTQYKVELIFRGIHWTVIKRYRDFETFHRRLIYGLPDEELCVVPELPKKRWFEKQRWINRFDDTYSRNRRFALQDYLRMIIRTFLYQENRNAFVDFLEIPIEAMDQEDLSMYNQYTEQEVVSRPEGHSFSHEDGIDEFQNDGAEQNVIYAENDPLGNTCGEGVWRDMEEDEEEGEEGQNDSTSSSPIKHIVLSEESDSDDEAVEN
jgi:hypothetical protein